MKKIGLSLWLVLFMQLSSWAQEGIQVLVKQNGNIIPIQNGIVSLKNSDFQFEVIATNVEDFLIGATFDQDLYRSALGEADLEVSWFNSTAVADELFNPNQELIISDEVPSYWYYTDAQDHRFDRNPKGDAARWIGTRSIKTLNVLSSYESIPLIKNKNTVYVYFYSPVYDDEYNMTDAIILYTAELRFN